MIRNYLKIALRSLLKNKVYTIINVVGLSIGVASCLLIVMFVSDEFSYDQFHNNADRIYKVVLERKYPNHSTYFAVVPHSYADVMQRDFPEVEQVVHMGGPFNDQLVSYRSERNETKHFEEDFIMAADSNFFNVFSIVLLKGSAQNVLLNISDVVLTEHTAKRYFGNEDPIGKTIKFFGQDFKISGVCENVPENSHFKFNFLVKWNPAVFGPRTENFTTFTSHIYLLLKPQADAKALENKFPKMVDTYAAAQIEADLGKSWEEYKNEGNGYRYFLQPLQSIHLDPTNIEAKTKQGGNINHVYFLICVALLIVVIACINFMNLATARSAERAREVGVRKTIGSVKSQLVFQFLIESVLLSFIATGIAIIWVYLLLPGFNQLAGKQLEFSFTTNTTLLLVVTPTLTGLLAGSYPAFVLSSFNPIVVMKGDFTGNKKGAWLRNGLVVFQFWISIVLIIGTIIVYNQMKFMQEKSLGYNTSQLMVVERVFALEENQQAFLNEIRKISGVENIGSSFSMLGREGDFFGAQFIPQGSSEILTTKGMSIDDDFAETVGFEFTKGRGYSKETNDSLSIILNEAAVKVLDVKNPIGQRIEQLQRTPNGNVMVPYTIIGVIKDFNFQSLHDPITPLVIQSSESFGGGVGFAYIRIKGSEMIHTILDVEKKWKELAPEQPFKYRFLDETIRANYDTEKKAGILFSVFSALAILIACVGLFGLAAYTSSLRKKEIGIRKVLGASTSSVVMLLSNHITKLVALAFALAVPLSWYLMDNWLNGFAYRVVINPLVFVLAGTTALSIALLTVSYQSIKAAIQNPIRSLRRE